MNVTQILATMVIKHMIAKWGSKPGAKPHVERLSNDLQAIGAKLKAKGIYGPEMFEGYGQAGRALLAAYEKVS